MIDYIEATKHLSSKDKPFLGYLQAEASYSSGWNKYTLEGCKKLEVWHSKQLEQIRIKGSLMYYWKGHNFTYDKTEFIQAVAHISKLLQVNLWDAIIDKFEFGTIITLNEDERPKDYINNHLGGNGLVMNQNPKDIGKFKYFKGDNISLKLYDAGRNIQHKQGTTMKKTIEQEGWNPENKYIKIEAHYLKPHIHLNNGRGILLTDLMNKKWETILKTDLYNQYKRIIPMKTVIHPKDKKNLSSADIILLALAEVRINEGESLQNIQKMLYNKVNSIPEGILSEADKKARKRQIKAMLEKVETSEESRWDLSDKLKEILT